MPTICCSKKWQRVSDHTAQGRGAQIPWLLTIPMEVAPNDFDSSSISPTKATETRVAASCGSRRTSKLQTPRPTFGNVEELTDSPFTSSKTSTQEQAPTEQQLPEKVLC